MTTPQTPIPEVTTTASVQVSHTATGLSLGQLDIGPIAGFSCSVKGVTVTFDGQLTGDNESFDIGFLCAMSSGDTIPVGGFGILGTRVPALALVFVNFPAPINYAGTTFGRLNCSMNVMPK